MKTAPWIKPFAVGIAVGAVALGAYGFTAGGWMTAGKASILAGNMARAEVAAALVPVCIEQAKNDPQRSAVIAALRDARDYERKQMIIDAGWATVPGTDSPNNVVASSCLDVLSQEL